MNKEKTIQEEIKENLLTMKEWAEIIRWFEHKAVTKNIRNPQTYSAVKKMGFLLNNKPEMFVDVYQ